LVYFLGLFVRIEYLTALLGFFLFGPALYSALPCIRPRLIHFRLALIRRFSAAILVFAGARPF
jgi:hypothetical protein